MTVPSVWLDAVSSRLAAALADDGIKAQVREVDDTTLGDLGEYTALPQTGILLTCMGFNAIERDVGPTTIEATFIARCISRLSEKPDALEPLRSRGDVAMNLAAFVVRTLDQGEAWADAAGEPLAFSRAKGIKARNFGTRELHKTGRSLWLVSWMQQAEISGELDALLYPLKLLTITLTPDVAAELELEGATL